MDRLLHSGEFPIISVVKCQPKFLTLHLIIYKITNFLNQGWICAGLFREEDVFCLTIITFKTSVAAAVCNIHIGSSKSMGICPKNFAQYSKPRYLNLY